MKAKRELGDMPIETDHRETMNQVARALDQIFNGPKRGAERETGFVLLVFPFGDKVGRCNYISNGADRRDVILLLKKQLARFEGQADLSGTA